MDAYLKPIKIILTLMHVAGIIGLQFNATQKLFQILTPYNLLASALILVYFHEQKSRQFYYIIFVPAILGFLAELLGVHTGLIFGSYQYGATLGFKIYAVPVIIGVNWFILSYLACSLVQNSTTNVYVKSMLCASILTVLDVFIEPVAIRFDFWQWSNNTIPLLNYIGWFWVSFLICLINFKIFANFKNKIATLLFTLQAFFFFIHNSILFLR